MELMNLRSGLMAQMASSAKSKSGTFTGDGTKSVDLQIGFEPDVIVIDSGLHTNVAGPVGLYLVTLVKNIFTLNATHNSTTDTNSGRTMYGQLIGYGWGSIGTIGAYRNIASYNNGVLTISNATNSPSEQYRFIEGQTYTWTAYKA